MTARIPGPAGAHSHKHHRPHHGHTRAVNSHDHHATDAHLASYAHADPRPAGAPAVNVQQMIVPRPPSKGLYVRYFTTWHGDPVCEVWDKGQRVDPPPYLVARADKTKNDCIFRVGDTLSGGKIPRDLLSALGFNEPRTDVFTALLFFLLDVDSGDDRYDMLLTIREIHPDGVDPWTGSIVFSRSIVVNGTVLLIPRQSYSRENFQTNLIWARAADDMEALLVIIEGFYSYMLDVLWALTGGFEAELAEKYVGREFMRAALKYMKPKFVAIAKAYMLGFLKEVVRQALQRVLYLLQTLASNKLMSAPGRSGAITVEDIHLLQSSGRLARETDLATMDWAKCHAKGMEDALTPFWKIFGDSNMATGPLRRFTTQCSNYVEKFFFDLGLLAALRKGEDFIAKQIGKAINDKIAEATADWIRELAGSRAPVEPQTAGHRFEGFALSKLTDGTIFDLTVRYFETHWEELVKAALDKAKDELVKAVHDEDAVSKT